MSTTTANSTELSEDRYNTARELVGKINQLDAGTITQRELDELANEMQEVVLPLAGHEARRRSK